MSAKVLFLTKAADVAALSAKPILTVPLTAVATRGGKKVVYAVHENQAVEMPIVVGREFGALVEVTQGLSSGDKVITSVTEQIAGGSRIKIR